MKDFIIMPTIRYDRERIHRLYLLTKGDIHAVMRHRNMPKSQQTIKRYAKEGRWYEELSKEIKLDQNDTTIPTLPSNEKMDCEDEYPEDLKIGTEALKEDKEKNAVIDDDSDDIEKLRQVKNVLYQFLIPNPSGKMEGLELKPKTYAEAVKCYLDIDSRISDKKSKTTNSGFSAWEEIMRRCMSS
jgi:hypothetical protein